MPIRSADAVWEGGLRDGRGRVALGSGQIQADYSFGTRFEDAPGTNPEELIGAAHAGCFAMALSAGLGKAGFAPRRIAANAKVSIDKVGDGFKITKIVLSCEAHVPGIDPARFQQIAEATKTGCPVSQALSATPIELQATLVS